MNNRSLKCYLITYCLLLPMTVKSSGCQEASYGRVPLWSVLGQAGKVFHRLATPIFEVVHPHSHLTASGTGAVGVALQYGFRQGVASHYMPKPVELSLFDSCQLWFKLAAQG